MVNLGCFSINSYKNQPFIFVDYFLIRGRDTVELERECLHVICIPNISLRRYKAEKKYLSSDFIS